MDRFGSCFLRTSFQVLKTKRTPLVFSKNCFCFLKTFFCSLILVFYVFLVFLRTKKYEPNVFFGFFLFSLFFRIKNSFKKG